jgi:uncharacterized protein YecT (DUF1311 family)
MRRRLALAALATAIATTGPAAAQDLDCGKAVSTPEITACAARDLDRADRGLNDAYRAALARIDKADMDPGPRAEWRKALQDAQRKWIAYRDADCDGALAFEWYGGTGASAAVLGCKHEMTLARTKQLKERGNN